MLDYLQITLVLLPLLFIHAYGEKDLSRMLGAALWQS